MRQGVIVIITIAFLPLASDELALHTSGMVSNPFPPQEVATKSGGRGFFGLFLTSGIVPEIGDPRLPEIGEPGLPG